MTEAQTGYWKKYCSEPLELIENYQQALAEDFKDWCIHHRGEILPCGRFSVDDLKKFGLYYNRPAPELVFMKVGEHSKLHNAGEGNFWFGIHRSVETRLKISKAHVGKMLSTKHRQKLSEVMKGMHHSTETRRKLSEAAKGKQLSADTRRKISESAKGKQLSADTRRKLSEALSGDNHPMYGKHLSEDTRHKLSQSLKGKTWWNNGISNKRSRECPGEGWKRGCLKKS